MGVLHLANLWFEKLLVFVMLTTRILNLNFSIYPTVFSWSAPERDY